MKIENFILKVLGTIITIIGAIAIKVILEKSPKMGNDSLWPYFGAAIIILFIGLYILFPKLLKAIYRFIDN